MSMFFWILTSYFCDIEMLLQTEQNGCRTARVQHETIQCSLSSGPCLHLHPRVKPFFEIWNKNASVGCSIHQTAMAVHHCRTALVCGGHLDRHWSGTEVLSRKTFCVDRTDFAVCSRWAAGGTDLQLRLVQRRHELWSIKSKRKNNRNAETWTSRPAPICCGHLHEVRNSADNWDKSISSWKGTDPSYYICKITGPA